MVYYKNYFDLLFLKIILITFINCEKGEGKMNTSTVSLDEYVLSSIEELSPTVMFNNDLVQSKNVSMLIQNLDPV